MPSLCSIYINANTYSFRKNFASILGYDLDKVRDQDPQYFNSRIHPDDLLAMMTVGIQYLDFALRRSPDERKQFKLIQDFRIRKESDEWIRVI